MSGAGWAAKNDVRSARYLIEAKRTDNKKQITLEVKALRDVFKNAVLDGRTGVLAFELDGLRCVVLKEDDEWTHE